MRFKSSFNFPPSFIVDVILCCTICIALLYACYMGVETKDYTLLQQLKYFYVFALGYLLRSVINGKKIRP